MDVPNSSSEAAGDGTRGGAQGGERPEQGVAGVGRPRAGSSEVQEAAARLHPAARATKRDDSEAERVARRYFEAISERDLQAAVALWAPGGREHVRGLIDEPAPEGVRAFIGEMLHAMPDLRFEVLSTTTEGERCGVQWRLIGTFAGPGRFNGIAPTGDRLTLEGIDLLHVRDGLIQSNDAYSDTITLPREIGMMPPLHSAPERTMISAFNLKTKVGAISIKEAQLIADGVWVLQGQPGRCNVYLIEDEGGVTLFDAGARTMARSIATAAAKLGGLRRVVLGHAHTDHRGAAPALGVPVLCHPDEVSDAEGSGGFRYWPADLSGLPTPQRQIHKLLHKVAWDGGPVNISKTVSEGEEIAGFRVIHLPGHAPGLIALWRERDRLALCTDCFYTLDMWGKDCPPHLPERIYNLDTEQARQSLRKLAALEPQAAWPGHAHAVTGDVKGKLLTAAESS